MLRQSIPTFVIEKGIAHYEMFYFGFFIQLIVQVRTFIRFNVNIEYGHQLLQ